MLSFRSEKQSHQLSVDGLGFDELSAFRHRAKKLKLIV
jgi:hypothetical protein